MKLKFSNVQGPEAHDFDFFNVFKLQVTRVKAEAKDFNCVGNLDWSGVE